MDKERPAAWSSTNRHGLGRGLLSPPSIDYLPVGGVSDLAEGGDLQVSSVGQSTAESTDEIVQTVLTATGELDRLGYARRLIIAMLGLWVLMLPGVVAAIVLVVQHSLALAFSLAGIVAGVRFRRALQDTFDTLFILVAIGAGIAADPAIPVVDQIRRLERRDVAVPVALDVSDRDDPVHITEVKVVGLKGRRAAGQGNERQRNQGSSPEIHAGRTRAEVSPCHNCLDLDHADLLLKVTFAEITISRIGAFRRRGFTAFETHFGNEMIHFSLTHRAGFVYQ